jgi:hypothetical protein
MRARICRGRGGLADVLRAVAVVLGVGVAMAGCGAASPQGQLVALRVPTRSYHDPAGWAVRFPTAFHLDASNQEQGVAMTEGTVASFALRSGIVVHRLRDGGSVRVTPPLPGDGRFPPDGVALRVVNDASNPFVPPHHPPPRLPLRLSSFEKSKPVPSTLGYNGTTGETYNTRYHGAPRSVFHDVIANGGLYQVVVWIGRHADARDRATIAEVVASLRFPRTREAPKRPARTDMTSG